MGGSAGAGGAGGSCEGCVEYIAVRARYSTHPPLVSAMGPEPGAFLLTTNINAPASATREANPGATAGAPASHTLIDAVQPRKRPRPGDAKRMLCRRTASLTGEAVRASVVRPGPAGRVARARGVSNTSRSARRIRHTPARPPARGSGAWRVCAAYEHQRASLRHADANPGATAGAPATHTLVDAVSTTRTAPSGDAKRMRCRRTASLTGEAVRTWASRPGPAGGWLVEGCVEYIAVRAKYSTHPPLVPAVRPEPGASLLTMTD